MDPTELPTSVRRRMGLLGGTEGLAIPFEQTKVMKGGVRLEIE